MALNIQNLTKKVDIALEVQIQLDEAKNLAVNHNEEISTMHHQLANSNDEIKKQNILYAREIVELKGRMADFDDNVKQRDQLKILVLKQYEEIA